MKNFLKKALSQRHLAGDRDRAFLFLIGIAMPRLKVTRATDEEIDRLNDLLNDLEAHHRYSHCLEIKDSIEESPEDYPIISQFNREDPTEFINDLCQFLYQNRWEVVIFNLRVLLDNCADLTAETLEFKPEIARALEFYDTYGMHEVTISDPGDECESVKMLAV